MAQFRYRAVNRAGKNLRGYIEAADQVAAAAELRKQGLFPLQLAPAAGATRAVRKINVRFLAGGRVKLQEFAPFCRQFATLIRAGVSVTQSLQVLAAQAESRVLKKALLAVEQDVRQGMSLREAFARHEKVFPEIFVNMVAAGEYSGQLEAILDRMANFFEQRRVTSQKLVSALIYPTVVFLIAVGVSVFLLTSVVPVFAQAFAQQGVELPFPTKITLAVSGFLVHRWYLAVGGVTAAVLAAVAAVGTDRGRLLWDSFKLRVPVFGQLYRKTVIARFARTFATLEASAVPILEQLELVRKVIGNRLFGKALAEAQQNLRKGERLSATLEKYPLLFPAMVVQMVAVGEETGELESLMENVAGFYEMEVVELSSRLSGMLEPLLILFLAVVVGLIILSVYLPMFTMFSFVR